MVDVVGNDVRPEGHAGEPDKGSESGDGRAQVHGREAHVDHFRWEPDHHCQVDDDDLVPSGRIFGPKSDTLERNL